MAFPQEGSPQSTEQAVPTSSRHTIMNIFLFILLAAWVANILYNNSSAQASPEGSVIRPITTEFNAPKTNLTKWYCDAIKDAMTYKQVIAILGTPTMKTESNHETAGKTEIRQYQQHQGKNIKACTIIFAKEKVFSKTWVEYVNWFIMKY